MDTVPHMLLAMMNLEKNNAKAQQGQAWGLYHTRKNVTKRQWQQTQDSLPETRALAFILGFQKSMFARPYTTSLWYFSHHCLNFSNRCLSSWTILCVMTIGRIKEAMASLTLNPGYLLVIISTSTPEGDKNHHYSYLIAIWNNTGIALAYDSVSICISRKPEIAWSTFRIILPSHINHRCIP